MIVHIRNYTSLDYVSLAALLNRTYNSNISQETLELYYQTDSRKILIAKEENSNHVLGCAFIEKQVDYIRPKNVLFVTYVAVDESYRGQGIGKLIMQEVEDRCKKLDCSAIELTSADIRTGAHAFYERLGFSRKKTTVFIKEV